MKRSTLIRSHALFVCLGLVLLLSNSSSYAQNEAATVIRVGLLIDGSGGEPLKDAVIVIRGKRIEAVGRNGDIKLPQGAKTLDLRKKVAIPGLIDAHAHYREWQGELYVNHGVTTALDIGSGVGAWTVAQRDGINKGLIVGPRLLWGPRINAPAKGEGIGQELTEAMAANPDEARKEVQTLIARGADIIKALDHLNTELLKAIVEEAHRGGKRVITHAINGTEAVLAGVDIDSIEHSPAVGLATVSSEESRKKLEAGRTRRTNRMTTQEVHAFMEEDQYDRVIQALVKKNVHWTPTVANTWRAFSPKREQFMEEEMKLFAQPGLRYIPPHFRANTKEHFEGTAKLDPKLLQDIQTGYKKTKDLILRFARAGGKLQVSSDPNSVLPGLGVHYDMEIFVEAGLSPMEALLAGTKNPAERLGREKDFGMIAPGRFADLVIVDANPLEDISATRKIHLVFKEGKEIKPKYHANYRNPIPQPFPDRASPQIESISPLAVKQGEGPVQINIKGQNFMSSAIVKINGTKVATEVKFSPINFPQNARRTNQIVATVDPKVVSKPGTYPVIVEHEGMGGSVSNAAYLVVNFR